MYNEQQISIAPISAVSGRKRTISKRFTEGAADVQFEEEEQDDPQDAEQEQLLLQQQQQYDADAYAAADDDADEAFDLAPTRKRAPRRLVISCTSYHC